MDAQRPPEDTVIAQNMARTADNIYALSQASANSNSLITSECEKIVNAINTQGAAIIAAIKANTSK